MDLQEGGNVARDRIELPTRGFSAIVDTGDHMYLSANIQGISGD
jgi:hypothetical protein